MEVGLIVSSESFVLFPSVCLGPAPPQVMKGTGFPKGLVCLVSTNFQDTFLQIFNFLNSEIFKKNF